MSNSCCHRINRYYKPSDLPPFRFHHHYTRKEKVCYNKKTTTRLTRGCSILKELPFINHMILVVTIENEYVLFV